jgi:hypothetical protein
MFEALHQTAAFEQLARDAGIEEIVREYEQMGVGFFFLPHSVPCCPPTGYNRDFVHLPGCQAGDVHIRPADLEGCDLSPEPQFACRLLHELGHYESFAQGLNGGCELLAWYNAGKLAERAFGNPLPDWWISIRRTALSKYKIQWNDKEAESCSQHRCSHG